MIHTQNPNLLGQFDHKVDDKLSAMIPDGRRYHQVYERCFFDDTHLVYRVKPSSRKRPLSTMDFKTYSPQNKGKRALTHPQMAMMISGLCQEAESPGSAHPDDEIVLENDKEVQLNNAGRYEPFQECTNRQAKAVTERDCADNQRFIESCWKNLAPYVCCFTQIEGGGSVYFGVSEGKDKSEMWREANQRVVCLTQFGTQGEWKIWEDAKRTEQDIYYVAKEGKLKEQSTGKFLAKPVPLPEQDHEDFVKAIQTKVKNDLKWVGAAEPQDPVQVRFHPVANAPQDQCVIEIKINYYHGLCYYSKTGPESFRCKFRKCGTTSPPPVEQIEFSEWINDFKPGAAGILKEW